MTPIILYLQYQRPQTYCTYSIKDPKNFFFKKNGPIPASFSLFSTFQYTVDSKQMFNINKFLPMTGFEPRTPKTLYHIKEVKTYAGKRAFSKRREEKTFLIFAGTEATV